MRFFGVGQADADDALRQNLRRATEASSVMEVPKDALLVIAQCSHVEADRREIMRHLASCLSAEAPAEWRRVALALAVLLDLFDRGSKALLQELGAGVHFDVSQRLALLRRYNHKDDDRAATLIRRRAQQAADRYVSMQRDLDAESVEKTSWTKSSQCVAFLKHNDCDSTDDEASEDEGPSPSNSATDDASSLVSGSPGCTGNRPAAYSSDASVSPQQRSSAMRLLQGEIRSSVNSLYSVGDICRTRSPVTVREAASLESEELTEFDEGFSLAILEVGAGRRVKVRFLDCGTIGWISVKTRTGIPLIQHNYVHCEGFD